MRFGKFKFENFVSRFIFEAFVKTEKGKTLDMKTKMRKYLVAVWLLLASVVGFSSCDVEFHGDYGSYTERLCGPVWTDSWYEGFFYYEQRFVFYSGGRGVEYYFDGMEYRYDFYWYWSRNGRSIVMEYGPYDVSYFDDVVIDRGILSGYLNDQYVEFAAY